MTLFVNLTNLLWYLHTLSLLLGRILIRASFMNYIDTLIYVSVQVTQRYFGLHPQTLFKVVKPTCQWVNPKGWPYKVAKTYGSTKRELVNQKLKICDHWISILFTLWLFHCKTQISSFWLYFHHWPQRYLLFQQLLVAPPRKISSKWHFCFYECSNNWLMCDTVHSSW